MGLLSLLPAQLSIVETWVTRLFLLLALITIIPWVLLIVYDLVLYVVRAVTYEIPIVGGRARGKMRPRAPSLTERPDGHRRRFSLAHRPDGTAQTTGGEKNGSPDARWRNIKEETEEDASMTGE